MGILVFNDPDKDYAKLPNAALRDKRLSFTAIGLLAHISSHQDGYKVTVESLARASNSGDTQTRNALTELREAGYIHFCGRVVEKGRFTSSEWNIFLIPECPDPSLSDVDIPHTEKPHVEKPHEENTHVEKPREGNNHVYKENQSKKTNLRKPIQELRETSSRQEIVLTKPSQEILVTKSTASQTTHKIVKHRDELFEAVCQACGSDWNEITNVERARLNKAVKELRDAGATPADVEERAMVFQVLWPNIKLTAMGLVGRWSESKQENIERIVTPGMRDKLLDDLEKKRRYANLEQKAINA